MTAYNSVIEALWNRATEKRGDIEQVAIEPWSVRRRGGRSDSGCTVTINYAINAYVSAEADGTFGAIEMALKKLPVLTTEKQLREVLGVG